ncbi:Cupin 2 conserved barrel domain protein [Kribbella flavida DSM 17836]|uniref:Cupin 2 conserved barrel domain protein n=1 Tax=Kribbella flavida (strain DSM 17836 / JCM 10339 / NBRC 14399) TaxID=479435 RepID=D2PX79_KRIFD|nr:cupin domain-containing protein [Kribbella flavida]ADB29727.1 Cupin 2 conserved barrel domain protein [Kribbella flavida DSM 17836]
MQRITETPNAVMTTYASPTQGSQELSVWRVDMKQGAQGPWHSMDSEQVWTGLAGAATVQLGDEQVELRAGSAVVLPAGVERRISATEQFTAIVAGYGHAKASVRGEDADRGTPAWIS